MNEFNLVCMKTYTAVFVRAWEPIFQVSFYRATHGCQLAAYLVVAPCLKVNFKQGVVVRTGYCAVAEYGLL